MKCHSCLKPVENTTSFCEQCSHELFEKKIQSAVLPFVLTNYSEKIQKQLQKNSLVGFQDKIFVKINGKWTIPEWGKVTHLIKIPKISQISAYKLAQDMAANEHLTMQLAKQVFQLPTAECAFMYLEDKQAVYLTKLFDRKTAKDFAVLLDTTVQKNPDYKYDSSYEEIAECITLYSEQKIIDLVFFYKLFIFNILTRNGDAHLRNFSMYYQNDTFCLTPAYDLLSTLLHLPDDRYLACYLYKNDSKKTKFDAISYKKLMTFGKKIGLTSDQISQILDFFSGQKSKVIELIENSFLSENAKNKYKNLIQDGYKIIFQTKK
ncbi:MAG: type II toxin-antitoxin system HipA family toxin [Bacteroidetes bacterium]|nr:MAG: type II toxin-antitoxin system HipA family toxin [Bacteroidota bacterium]